MSKNKKQAAKRRQKKRERQKARRPARVARRNAEREARGKKMARHLKKVGEAKALLEDGVEVPDITEAEYIFWLCHGANYIASDEENGVWDPIFERLYDGWMPSKPEDIAQGVIDRYQADIDSEGPFVGTGAAVLAWTVTDKSQVRIYKYEAERRLAEKNPDGDAEALARQPHDSTVWSLMMKVKERALAAQPPEATASEE